MGLLYTVLVIGVLDMIRRATSIAMKQEVIVLPKGDQAYERDVVS
jgi:hypothetical protein